MDIGRYNIRVTALTVNRVNKTVTFFLKINEMNVNEKISTAHKAPYFASKLKRIINVTY